MFIDTHLHLSDPKFDADRKAVFARAIAAGVTHWVEIAESPDHWEAAVSMATQFPHVYAALGVHPHHAYLFGPAEWPALAERLHVYFQNPKVVAIGEFGLDYFRMENTKEQQAFLFRKQLELAQSLTKPIVIHCREGERSETTSAHLDVQQALAEFYPKTSIGIACPEPAGVIHCFSGLWSDAQTYFSHGFMVGVDGPVTYPSAKLLQENVRRMPLQRIVLETDSPYLPPQPHRGQRNEPSYLPMVAQAIATLQNKTVEAVAAQTTQNARALFRLPEVSAPSASPV